MDKPKFGGKNLLKKPCLHRKCENLKTNRKPSTDRRKLPSFDKIETFQLGFQIKTFSINLIRLDGQSKKEEHREQNPMDQNLHLSLKRNIDSILSEATQILHQESEYKPKSESVATICRSENRGELSIFSEVEDTDIETDCTESVPSADLQKI